MRQQNCKEHIRGSSETAEPNPGGRGPDCRIRKRDLAQQNGRTKSDQTRDHGHRKRDVRRPQSAAGHHAQMRIDRYLRRNCSAGSHHAQNVEVDHWRR